MNLSTEIPSLTKIVSSSSRHQTPERLSNNNLAQETGLSSSIRNTNYPAKPST